jgi:hypothetical protein
MCAKANIQNSISVGVGLRRHESANASQRSRLLLPGDCLACDSRYRRRDGSGATRRGIGLASTRDRVRSSEMFDRKE